MFKLIVIAALFAVAAARPGYLGGSPLAYSSPVHTTIVQEPTYAHVGSVIKSIPTSVSHHSISQVHPSPHYVQSVVSPLVHSYGAAPFVNSAYTSYEAAPVLNTYGSYAPHYAGSYGASYGGHAYGGVAYGSHGYGGAAW